MSDRLKLLKTPFMDTSAGTSGLFYIMFDDETPEIAASSGGFLTYREAEKAANEIMMLEPPTRTYTIFLKS